MDVTEQIIQSHIKYGGSDYNNPAYFGAQRKLNYSSPGGSITKPANIEINYFPSEINWKDTVGLFGAENYFVRVKVNIDFNVITKQEIINGYYPAVLSPEEQVVSDPYTTLNTGGDTPRSGQAYIDRNLDLDTVNTYEPADIIAKVEPIPNGVLSVDLTNKGTGNQYIDKHLDVRIYNSKREEHPYDVMYIKPQEVFYVGFHARNTRRLPFDVTVRIGDVYTDSSNIDSRYLS